MKGHFLAGTVVRTGVLFAALVAVMAATTQTSRAQGQTRSTATKVVKGGSSATSAGIRYSYFPSASTTDGRFLSIVGADLYSLTGDAIEFGIGLGASTDSLRIGFFDGETGGVWDLGSAELEFKLYADSTASGAGVPLLYTWQGRNMTDNGWYDITVPVAASARSTDTVYFYRLVISLDSTNNSRTWSNFKIRTNGSAMLLPRAFSYAVPLYTASEAQILYPNYPSQDSTTYDGTWSFHMSSPTAFEDIEIWDGDLDYGSYDGAYRDSNDADTPDSIPSWALNAVPEGVGTSSEFILIDTTRSTTTVTTGFPADDNANAWYRRGPSVEYELIDPNATTYHNGNPSGNLEWERFRVSTIATSASDYDYLTTILPAGYYTLKMRGMDVGNLNAWRIWYSVPGATDTATGLGSATTSVKNTEGPSTTSYRSHMVMVGVDSAGNPVLPILPINSSIGGVGNVNYWVSNNAPWPVDVITIGGVTYTETQARNILAGVTSDKSVWMARQLIAAKLNVLIGNSSSCIYETIADAEQWLIDYPIGTGNPNWTTGKPLYDALLDYNKGLSGCADYWRQSLD